MNEAFYQAQSRGLEQHMRRFHQTPFQQIDIPTDKHEKQTKQRDRQTDSQTNKSDRLREKEKVRAQKRETDK